MFLFCFVLDISVDGKNHNIILKDLKPETQYSVSVEAKGHDGTTMSKKSFFTTKKNGELHLIVCF